jgi:hypothetical protein
MAMGGASLKLSEETAAALTVGYLRYGTSARTTFVPISIGIRARYLGRQDGLGGMYFEGGPAIVASKWELSPYTYESRLLGGALGRAGVWVPVGKSFAVDLGVGYLFSSNSSTDPAPDRVNRRLEGVSSGFLQLGIVARL